MGFGISPSAFLGAILLGCMAAPIWMVYYLELRKSFYRTFEELPVKDAEIRGIQYRKKVDPELRRLARCVSRAQEQMAEFYTQLGNDSYDDSSLAIEAKRAVLTNLRIERDKFNKAVRLARRFGYKVPRRYTDYL